MNIELHTRDVASKQLLHNAESMGQISSTSVQQVKKQMEIDPSYQPTIQEKTIMHAIEEANKKLQGVDKEFEFTIHEKTKQIMIKVLDTTTKEVIKEFPPEKILDMVAAMCEQAGLFVDKKI